MLNSVSYICTTPWLIKWHYYLCLIGSDNQWTSSWWEKFRVLLKRGLQERRHESFSAQLCLSILHRVNLSVECFLTCVQGKWGLFSVEILNMMPDSQSSSDFLADMGRLIGWIWSLVSFFLFLFILFLEIVYFRLDDLIAMNPFAYFCWLDWDSGIILEQIFEIELGLLGVY